MKGYKGFSPGLVCKGKQYTENTVFEEDTAEICESGMHFCKSPFDVWQFYPPCDENGNLNEFAEVEALDEDDIQSDANEVKFCTKKLKVGAKLKFADFVKIGVDFVLEKSRNSAATNTGNRSAATNTGYRSAATNTGYRSAATNTGDMSAATNTGYMSAATNTGNRSAATNTGDMSAATNTGDRSAATNTGYMSAASVSGLESFAICTGVDSQAKGALGCFIALAEWKQGDNNEWHVADFKAAIVDGEKIKPDTWYKLIDGEFVEQKENCDG